MMIVLTDTSEEVDVHINDWFVEENLALRGKMVRTDSNFPFHFYMSINSAALRNTEVFKVKSVIGIDEAKFDRNRLMLCDEKVNKLSNVENCSSEKNIQALRSVSNNRKAITQSVIQDVKSNTKTLLDANSRSRDCSTSEKPRGPRELAILLEKLKMMKSSSPDVTPYNIIVSSSEKDRDDAQLTDLDVNIDSRNHTNSSELKKKSTMKFVIRDSDNEDENDFGLFRSYYSGQSKLEPFDWKVIRETDSSRPITSNSDLESNKTCKNNNETKDKFIESDVCFRDEKKNKLPVQQCFLNMTRNEDELYLTDGNIDYDIRNVSQSVAKLKNRLEIYNDLSTPVVITKDILEILRNGVQTQNTPNSNANIVENENTASLLEEFQDTDNEVNGTNKNIEACETEVCRETEYKANFNKNVHLVSCNANDNKDSEDRNAPKHNVRRSRPIITDNLAGKFSPKYKLLLEQMNRMRALNSSFDNNSSTESSSSELVQSSYSTRNSTNDTIILSENEQNEEFDKLVMRFNQLRNSIPTEIKTDSKRTDSIDSCANIFDLTQHRSDAIDNTHASTMLQQVLRMQQNIAKDTELDSDDLSEESNKSDKSGNKMDRINSDAIVTYNSLSNDDTNASEEIILPVINDCDSISDENEWDTCVEPEHFRLFFKGAQ